MTLTDKVALVTGASSGIGRAIAQALAMQGATVALVARNADKLAQAVAQIPRARAYPCDLTAQGAAAQVVAEVARAHGRLDILVANAGIYFGGEVADADPQAIDQLIATNVTSVFQLIHAGLPWVLQSQGDVLVTSSVSGHQAIPWEPVYSASKHAVQSFVHGLRQQVGPKGVRVMSLAPGIVLNDLWGISSAEEIAAKVEAGEGLRSEDAADAALYMLTRPRHVTIRDLVILPRAQPI